MKYPIEIENKINAINQIISSWPVKKSLNEVISWMLQFDNEDFDLAFRIIKNLNVIGPEELNSSLSIAYSKLNRQAQLKKINLSLKNTLYVSIGGAGKSGAMIAYNFRLINELSSANFLDDDSIKYLEEGKIENLVLIDDFIGTGEQASKELKEISEKVLSLGVKNIFVLTAIGFKSGIKKLQETELADVFSALEFDDKDSVNSLDSNFYEGLTFSARKNYFEKFSKYRGLGYRGLGALIVFYYNTPNATINCICGDTKGWIPLFPRISNVTGIDKHYPKLEQANVRKDTLVSENVLNIYVEGKLDELFFELIYQTYPDKFKDFNKVEIISIGPFYSPKLIESLKLLSTKYLFISEKDVEDSPHTRRINSIMNGNNILLTDDIITFFNIDQIIESDYFNLKIDEKDKENLQKYLNIKLFRRVSPNVRQDNLEILFREFRNEEKLNALIQDILNKLTPSI